MTREEMFVFIDAILEQASVPDVLARLTEQRLATVRFGQNRITQNVDTFERRLRLTLGDGKRQAVYSTHRIDMDAIPSILDSAMEMLETATPDPEYMPPVPAGQVYPIIEKWDAETAMRFVNNTKGMLSMGLLGATGALTNRTQIVNNIINYGWSHYREATKQLAPGSEDRQKWEVRKK